MRKLATDLGIEEGRLQLKKPRKVEKATRNQWLDVLAIIDLILKRYDFVDRALDSVYDAKGRAEKFINSTAPKALESLASSGGVEIYGLSVGGFTQKILERGSAIIQEMEQHVDAYITNMQPVLLEIKKYVEGVFLTRNYTDDDLKRLAKLSDLLYSTNARYRDFTMPPTHEFEHFCEEQMKVAASAFGVNINLSVACTVYESTVFTLDSG